MPNAKLVSAEIIIGSQWGDEGKGKIIDFLSSDYVVRYQGGANAGHTLMADQKKIILHLIPSGILHSYTHCVISNGVVLDVLGLKDEINHLKQAGYLKRDSQLLISDTASLLLDYHKDLDLAREEKLGRQKIGTTCKGIGPAYEDRSSRKALLLSDLFLSNEELEGKLVQAVQEKLFLLSKFYGKKPSSVSALLEKLKKARPLLEPYRCPDTSLVIDKALKENKKVLFEGAQGVLLDLFYGTYPYVTSSSTLSGAAFTGAGIDFRHITKVLGIFKAYTTRVGSGPFPSECDSKHQSYLEEKGKEQGSTTQRTRRCGWLDLVALKYAVRINGITHLALTKLDVLSGLKTFKVCTAYVLNGKPIEHYPINKVNQCQPVYKEFQGWNKDLSSCKKLEDLPEETQVFLQFIENSLNIPIEIISVGPNREETIVVSSH